MQVIRQKYYFCVTSNALELFVEYLQLIKSYNIYHSHGWKSRIEAVSTFNVETFRGNRIKLQNLSSCGYSRWSAQLNLNFSILNNFTKRTKYNTQKAKLNPSSSQATDHTVCGKNGIPWTGLPLACGTECKNMG
jgi:hypothetical protein